PHSLKSERYPGSPHSGMKPYKQGKTREMAFIGIDVSKKKLDVLWLRQSRPQKIKTRVFLNQPGKQDEVVQ
ncbi:hypothetical protein SAMN05877962_1472, partial [Alloalcanivorax xenomutans]